MPSDRASNGLVTLSVFTNRDSNAVSSSDGNDEVTALAYDNLLFPFVTLLAGIILSGIMMGVEKVRLLYACDCLEKYISTLIS